MPIPKVEVLFAVYPVLLPGGIGMHHDFGRYSSLLKEYPIIKLIGYF
jgi:hypothetical protein